MWLVEGKQILDAPSLDFKHQLIRVPEALVKIAGVMPAFMRPRRVCFVLI